MDVILREDGILLRLVPGDDPLMRAVADLCYETLHRPFGVTRCDAWNETDPYSTHIVALDGPRLAGYARLLREGSAVHIRQVAIAPRYRRRGLASALVRELLEIARREGFPVAYLHARLPAVPLYERLGFRVTGQPFRMGRTWVPHVRMELRLR